MPLSDLIRKIEENPRSTKIAGVIAVAAIAIAAALAITQFNQNPQPDPSTQPTSIVQIVVATPTTAPNPTSTNIPPTPTPIPTRIPTPQPTVPRATATPTEVAEPTVAPRMSDEVMVHAGSRYGTFAYYDDDGVNLGLYHFLQARALLAYLNAEGVITDKQMKIVTITNPIMISGDKLSTAIHQLLEATDKSYLNFVFEISETDLHGILYNVGGSLPES